MRKKLFDLGGPRHGVVASTDVRAAGIPRSSFERWRDREKLWRPHPDVTVLPGHPATTEQRLAVAVAGIGRPCAVTGWAAAYLFGLRRSAPSTVDVLVPHGESPRPHEHVRVVETAVFDDVRVDEIAGVAVVAPARFLADLSPKTELDTLLAMAIELRGRGLLGPQDLDRELGLRRRFPGRARFRALADMLREDGSDSGFEHRARGDLTARGMPPDPGQVEVAVSARHRRIDLGYEWALTGVECQGFAYHGREEFDRDAERHNDFVEDGTWALLELTWTMFLRRWDEFCARLQRVLEARS